MGADTPDKLDVESQGKYPTGTESARLLTQFIEQHDNLAFEALVQKYGRMVQGVCRRMLRNHHDAEDAFQATFFILAKKAASIARRRSVGVWLYGVARAVSRRAKRVRIKQQKLQAEVSREPRTEMTENELWSDVAPILDEEIARLPRRNRQAIILCDLQGLDHKGAAGELGCSVQTLHYRLTTGRQRLATRLTRRGVVLSSATLAVLLTKQAASAAVPVSLSGAVTAAGSLATGGTVPEGAVSATSIALAKGALKSFWLFQLAVVLGLGVFVPIAGAATWLCTTNESRSIPTAERPLVAPGADTEAVIAFLQRIIEGQNKADVALQTRLVRGRVSQVNAVLPANAPVAQPGIPPLLPPPNWHSFVEVHKGEKARFEEEIIEVRNDGAVATPVYRLADGDAFYALNGNALEIAPYDDVDRRWFQATITVALPFAVLDGKDFGPVNIVCKTHIDRLTQQTYFEEFHEQLVCYEADGLWVVEQRKEPEFNDPARAFMRTTFRVDPKLGYRLVTYDQETGQPGGGLHTTSQSEVTYSEVAVGVHLPSKARLKFSNLGSAAVREGRAGWGEQQVEITSVELGDFDYDDRQFAPESLPIPEGAYVSDRRFQPPRTFTFGKAPLDEQVLLHAARAKPLATARNARWRTWVWMIAAQVVVAAALLVLYWRARTKR